MPRTASRIDPADAATVTADLHNLPTGRVSAQDGTAHVFADDTDSLVEWHDALGGHTTRRDAGPGVVLWTLHTATEPYGDDSRTPVLVHTLALDHEPVYEALTTALAPTAA